MAADLQRPAAVEQLKVLGQQINVPVYSESPATPVDVCRNAVAYARTTLLDTVILDTAGRLHVDGMSMDELKQIDRLVKPDDVLLVCDAMTGQDAVNSAKAFNDAVAKLEPKKPVALLVRDENGTRFAIIRPDTE